jgi:hypothetical protein
MTPIAADFGPLVVETDVDRALIATLKLWLPTNLAQVERDRDLDPRTLARPVTASYSNVLEDDEFLDHSLPAILVTTADANNYDRGADGFYTAAFTCNVSSVVRGRTGPETREVASIFSGAVKRTLSSHPDLDGFASETVLQSSSVEPVADTTDQGRYLAVGMSTWIVYVDDVLQEGAGPTVPGDPYDDPDPVGSPDTPYDELATVSEVTSDIRGVPITATPGDD